MAASTCIVLGSSIIAEEKRTQHVPCSTNLFHIHYKINRNNGSTNAVAPRRKFNKAREECYFRDGIYTLQSEHKAYGGMFLEYKAQV